MLMLAGSVACRSWAPGETSGSTAQIDALYVLPERQGQGIGRRPLQAAATELAALGPSTLHIGVLTANLPARRFYEAIGGHEIGQRVFDEEGDLQPETVYAWPDIAAPGPVRRARKCRISVRFRRG